MLKGQLAMLEPCISAAGFLYEEGEGLEAEELADNTAKLAKPMAELPGGGLGHGVCADISDQSQALNFQLNITHQVWAGLLRPACNPCCMSLQQICAAGGKLCTAELNTLQQAREFVQACPVMRHRALLSWLAQCCKCNHTRSHWAQSPAARLQEEWNEETNPRLYVLSGTNPKSEAEPAGAAACSAICRTEHDQLTLDQARGSFELLQTLCFSLALIGLRAGPPAADGDAAMALLDDDEDDVVVLTGPGQDAAAASKRKAAAEEQPASKQAKLQNGH